MSATLANSSTRRGNLPAELSSFVGRFAELRHLAQAQAKSRLLTLVGPGGVGKTRLALQLVGMLRDAYPDGIWIVDLAPLIAPSLVSQAVADVLSVPEQADLTWASTLANKLCGLRLLLILDNCEHVLESCAELTSALLRACPDLHVLATSRQPLGVSIERVWRVSPLPLPNATDHDGAQVLTSEAVQLFLARATTRVPTFDQTDRSLRLIVEICRRLDGLPLALELVAARVESLDLADIAARLRTGLALRLDGRRTAPQRQQTLRATVDWSYQLLDDMERRLWIRLAIFASSWTLEAAETVCSDTSLPASSIAQLLDRLVTRSLVVCELQADGVRYRMLETLRVYALERLEDSREAATLRGHHAAFILAMAGQVSLDGPDIRHAAVLEREQAEIRAALGWLLEQGDAERGLHLATGAYSFWYLRGRAAEGCSWLEQLLALPAAEVTTWRATALLCLGQLLVGQGDYHEAEKRLSVALDSFVAQHDRLGIALTIRGLGTVAMWRGDLLTAASLLDDAAQQLRDLGNPGEFTALANGATVALELGEGARALSLAAHLEERGTQWQPSLALAWALLVRAGVAARDGAAVLAENVLTRALELEQPLDFVEFRILLLTELAHVQLDAGRAAPSRTALAEAVQAAYDTGKRRRLIRALEAVARSVAAGQPAAAVRLAGAAAAQLEGLAAKPWPRDVRRKAAWLPGARLALGKSAFQSAWESGRILNADEAVRLARSELDTAEQASGVLLTPRETQVADLLARGQSTRQIARELVVSVATVRVHVDHVMAKLDLHSRTQVALWVREHGLLAAHQSSPTPGLIFD